METIALSLSKGSSSWAREDQPSSRKRHLLRPEKMTLSGIAKCEYGLWDGDQRLLADQKASYKRKKKKNLNLGKLPSRVPAVKTSLWDCQGTACVSPSFSPCPCSRGPPCSCLLPACSLPAPFCFLPACTRIPCSSGASCFANSSAHQHFPLHKFWFSSLIVLQHLAWAFLLVSSSYLVPE